MHNEAVYHDRESNTAETGSCSDDAKGNGTVSKKPSAHSSDGYTRSGQFQRTKDAVALAKYLELLTGIEEERASCRTTEALRQENLIILLGY